MVRPPCFIETDDFDECIYNKYLAGKEYFLFFGSIGFLKGCEVLADSLPAILAEYPEMHFVFVGKVVIGTKRASYEELMEDGVSGVLVELNNPQALSQGMRRV